MEPKSPYDAALEQLNLLKQQLEIEVQEEPLEPTQAAPTESDVLAIAIDVGNGKEETIDVGRGDNPDLLASMFCVKHGLNERQRVKLAKIIEKNMAEAGIDTKPVERPSQNTRFTKTAIQRSSSTVPKGNSNAASVRGTATGSPLGFEAWQNEIVQCLKDRRKPQNHPKINELSEKIVAGKNRGTVPTYMRLYKQALAKQKTERAKERLNQSAVLTNTLGTTSIKPPHASSKILNYGERMYEKHKRKKEEKQQEWVRLKAEKEQKEMRSATFHPSLNSRSQSLVRSRSLAKPEERLLRLGQLANEKMENVRNMKVEQEKLGCPFKPSIGRKSDQLALNKYRMLAGNRGNDKFGKLFEDSKRRNQERDKILSMPPDVECTFKPNTTLTKGYQMLTPQGKPLLMRLTGDKKVWTQKLNASLANVAVEYKPTTGRPPKIERNTAGLPIGDYLYSQSKVKREGLAKKVESELNELKKNAGTSIIKDESRKLVERMKDSSYQKLFEMLDSDEDGLITAKDVDISSNKFLVPSTLLTLITPLLCDMEAEHQCLKFIEFREKMDNLYRVMTIPEKKVVLNFGRSARSGVESRDFSFKPEILGKSKELAAKRGNENLPERLMKTKRIQEIRLEELRKNRELESLENCTFHPILATKEELNINWLAKRGSAI